MSQKERAQALVDSYNATTGDRNLLDGYDCPICKNRGMIAVLTVTNGIYGDANRFCVCNEIRKQRLRLKKAGLLHMVETCTFDRYETPDAWQAAIKEKALRFTQDDEHRFFFIGGQSGAGKTHICTAITAHYIDQGKRAKYMVWIDESNKLKGLVTEPGEYAAAMDEIKKTEVLYIDDLFKPIRGANGQITPPSYADIRLAMEIINYRYNNPGLITIISGERTIDELLYLDEALAGRISQLSKEGGYCINLKKDSGRNWRLKGVTTI
jgi:DNA replication protein DnaC